MSFMSEKLKIPIYLKQNRTGNHGEFIDKTLPREFQVFICGLLQEILKTVTNLCSSSHLLGRENN